MHETCVVFPLRRGTRGIGQTDVLLIENPSHRAELLFLAGLDSAGGVGEVHTVQLDPGTHRLNMQYYFDPDTDMVVVEKFVGASSLHLAHALLESRVGVGVFDRVAVVELTGLGFLDRFLEQVATWQTCRRACFPDADKLLGLVNMVNDALICAQD